MRYKYTITKEGGETEEMEAMSWKKVFKKLLLKYSNFSGWVSYINKKGHLQERSFRNGRENTYGE
jgi:recombinational DNA repair protein RecT